MSPEFELFAEALAPANKTELWLAIRVLWYLETISKEADITPKRLAEVIQASGIRGSINHTRLGRNLKSEPSVVSGVKAGTVRIKLSSRSALAAELEPLLAIRPQPKIDDHVIPAATFHRTRSYLEKMVLQINGCYQMGFYDGCAVLSRRIMESLLIAAFEKTAHTDAIKQGSDYLMLSGIISAARSGQYFRLSRGIGEKMELIKNLGDTAAHNRSHITTKLDIDQIAMGLRQVLSELCNLADIHPR